MAWSDIEYLVSRLIRKYLFSKKFLSIFGSFIPYYEVSPGQISPTPIVKEYLKFASLANLKIEDKNILEIGIGVTNDTCYELVSSGARLCYGYEPYADFKKKLDSKIISKNYKYQNILNKVKRIKDLDEINSESIDIIVSNSVLEHVENIDLLCKHLKRVMKSNGSMMHIVDYRDHFFKYQFHFYKFNKNSWKIINPGLSRLRISDHIRIFNYYGFEANVLDNDIAIDEFVKFKRKNKISKEFSNYNDSDLATIKAVIFMKKKQNGRS